MCSTIRRTGAEGLRAPTAAALEEVSMQSTVQQGRSRPLAVMTLSMIIFGTIGVFRRFAARTGKQRYGRNRDLNIDAGSVGKTRVHQRR